MNDLQGLFDKLQEEKREQKEIRREYKDALSHDTLYQQTEEELKTLREKKKLIESEVRSQMGSRWERFEDLKFDIGEIQQMISDVAMSSIMKGESIAIKDAYDVVYEPKFSVTFKKADGVKDDE